MLKFLKNPIRFFSGRNKELIRNLLQEEIKPILLKINDDSQSHYEEDDSHFSILVVSDLFENKNTLARHKYVMGLLKDKGIMDKIHAVKISAKTEAEFEKSIDKK